MSQRKEEVTEKYRANGFTVPHPESMSDFKPTVLKESPDGKKRYIFSTTGGIALQLKRPDRESWESPFTLDLTGSKKTIIVLTIPENPELPWGNCYSFYEGSQNPRMPEGWSLSGLTSIQLEARYQTLCNGGGYTDEVIPERLDFDATIENFRTNYEQGIFNPPALVAAA